MTHPSKEDWMDYLYGELSTDRQRECNEHRKACVSCGEEIERLRDTMTQLDQWKLPAQDQTIWKAPTAIPWAIAAAAMIGIAFLFGFTSGKTQVDLDRLTAQVREQLQAEMLTSEPRSTDSTPDTNLELQKSIESLRREFQAQLTRHSRHMESQLQASRHQQAVSLNQLKMELETVALVGEDRYRNSRSELDALRLHAVSVPQHLATQSFTH